MKKQNKTQFGNIQHLKRLSAFINFALSICVGEDRNELSPSVRFKIAQFKVAYQMVILTDYQNNKSIEEAISIGNSIIL